MLAKLPVELRTQAENLRERLRQHDRTYAYPSTTHVHVRIRMKHKTEWTKDTLYRAQQLQNTHERPRQAQTHRGARTEGKQAGALTRRTRQLKRL